MKDKSYQDRRTFIKSVAGIGAGLAAGNISMKAVEGRRGEPGTDVQKESVAGLRTEPLELVRVGLIGLGNRGPSHLRRLLKLDGVVVNALCDQVEAKVVKCQQYCVKEGFSRPEGYSRGKHDYRRLLDRADIDLVIISTPWLWHAPMALETMNSGKHAAIEVPAAVTIEECWQLVDRAEETRKHCIMLENVCYGETELMVLNMVRQGLFGDLLHGEAAYIHDLRKLLFGDHYEESWRIKHAFHRDGNFYPTHGLGPVAQYMNINRGDRFDYLTSMSSPSLGLVQYAAEHLDSTNPLFQQKFRAGDMNTSLIKTAMGRTIMVQHNTTSPRPYTRINLIQGTRGIFRGYKDRIFIEGRSKGHEWENLDAYKEEFTHPLLKKVGAQAKKVGGHGGMDFVMLWRLIYCLRNGLPLDMDVYDAASWSAVSYLSEESVAHRGRSVDFPDFTRGGWKTTTPLGIVS